MSAYLSQSAPDQIHSFDRPIRVALISPKGRLYRNDGGIFKKSLRACPLTFPTLVSLAPQDLEIEFKIIDEGIEAIPEKLDVDLVGMTVITGSAPRAYELAKKIRAQGVKVVLGGPHITLAPEDAAPHADALVTGYAEETWPKLLRDFSSGNLQARYDMAPGFSFDQLETIPFPKREIMKKAGYLTTNTFEATRACVHDCDFCVVPAAWGRKPYLKPIAHVVDDIKQSGARKLIFYDLNLIANQAYARELFEALIPLKIQWFGLSTVLLTKNDDLLDLVVRSGCKGLLVGFESIAPESLEEMNKKFNSLSNYSEVIDKLQRSGIAINGTFVFGTDSDTKNCFDQVIDFVQEYKIDLPRFSIQTPFPGTSLFKRLEAQGRIISKNWELYDGQHVVFEPKKMSVDELYQGHERVWKKVYSYKNMLSRYRIREINPLLFWSSNIAYRSYAYNLSKFYTCTGGMI